MDGDARVVGTNHGIIVDAALYAAAGLGLLPSWLNESVTMYARRGEQSADRVFVGTYPSAERYGLRVVAAKPSYILAMKLGALERSTIDDRDYRDAINLGAECGVTTVDGLKDIYRTYFADREVPVSRELRFRDLADAIAAKLRSGE